MKNFLSLENGPVASPGKCGICGYGGLSRVYTDLQQSFEFYGSFIICELCIGAMAQDYGFIEPVRALALEQRVKEVELELERLNALSQLVEEFRDTLGNYDTRSGSSDSVPVVSDDSAGAAQSELDFSTDSELLDSANAGEDGESEEGEGSGDSETDLDNLLTRAADLSNSPTVGGIDRTSL